MIIVIEPICVGAEHATFNSAVLRIIAEVYPDEKICFFAEKEHLELVSSELPYELNERMLKEVISTPARRSSFWTRLRFEYSLLGRALKHADGEPVHMVSLCAQESMILALKAKAAFWKVPFHTSIFLHTHVSSLEGWRSRNPFVRLHDLKSSIAMGNNRRIAYIFLEESITNRVKEIIPTAARRMFSLPHPISPGELRNEKEYGRSFPLKVGFLGQTTAHKGYPEFLDIAAEVKRRKPGKIEFHVYGSVSDETRHLPTHHLERVPTERMLSRADFTEGIRRLHYICLPFSGNHYNLTASGVVLDAFASCTPLLTLPQPALRSIFKSASPGILAESVDEIVNYLTDFVDAPDWNQYQRQSEEAHRLAVTRSCAALVEVYKSIVAFE